MMVLRHIGPPSCTIVSHEDEEDSVAPIDLSNKHVPTEVPHHRIHSNNNNNNNNINNNNKSPFISIVPSLRNAHSQSRNLSILKNIEQNNNNRLLCRTSAGSGSSRVGASISDVRWHEVNIIHGNDEDNSYSSPDSGLQRDSPGEDDDQAQSVATLPLRSHNRQKSNLIPLSLIRARFNNHQRTSESSNHQQDDEEEEDASSTKSSNPPDQVKTKRARLEEMVTHIKQVKPPKIRSQRLSGDDDTSSGEQATSSDEITDDSPTDLRNESYRSETSRDHLNVPHDIFRSLRRNDDEPCNLTYPKVRNERSDSPHQEGLNPLDFWKNKIPLKNLQSLSPAEAAKMYGVDPETYQQQMMQLQLTSAAMMGDPAGLLKAMGSGYPPWVYLGYYSQLLQNFQAQELIRQYAMQSQSPTAPSVSQGDKSPSAPCTTLGSAGYTCQSPISPASLSEGPTGMDSDGSIVGQSTSGSANGKRAPRAMTGRHVRTGTGASPSTLQTLREKIEERQRLKAQQSQGGAQQSHSKGKTSNNTNTSLSLNTSNHNHNNNNTSNHKPSKKPKK